MNNQKIIAFKGDGTLETGRKIIEALYSLGGYNYYSLHGDSKREYYYIEDHRHIGRPNVIKMGIEPDKFPDKYAITDIHTFDIGSILPINNLHGEALTIGAGRCELWEHINNYDTTDGKSDTYIGLYKDGFMVNKNEVIGFHTIHHTRSGAISEKKCTLSLEELDHLITVLQARRAEFKMEYGDK